MSSKTGLTLGKFAPLHKGHQLMIETALAEVDELFVMVYNTDVISTPLQVRAGWIKALYPHVHIIEAWDGPEGYGNTPEIKRVQEEYILKKLNGRKITHFYSSEFYGEHVSQALNALDRRVDEARAVIPVSGTSIRENPFDSRAFLDPLVYQDLITKICFMGAPSTGKSTLAQALAKNYRTEFMPEYGAEFWLKHQKDRRITLEQFEEIPVEHIRRETELTATSRTYLFCDTSPITTYVFAKDYHRKAGPVLTRLARQAEKRYDLFFLCDIDIAYADTWDRSGAQKRAWFQKQIIADLQERRIPFHHVSGNLEERIASVERVLKSYKKFDNPLECKKLTPPKKQELL
jgi:NadR type nicotinamide-nucleotide adenylyltransferase